MRQFVVLKKNNHNKNVRSKSPGIESSSFVKQITGMLFKGD